MSRQITQCRICADSNLPVVLDLGEMELTGIFPNTTDEKITSGPLRLVKCGRCGLVQLDHNFPLSEMYGDNYGYRSGLNQSMVKHLEQSVKSISERVELKSGDLILDIGANDGTLLGFYPSEGLTIVGMDPTIKKFKEYYKPHIKRIEDFFSKSKFQNIFAGKKAKIITSFSMFYDLEHPQEFVNDIKETLATDGIWVFEQSYLPLMVERLSYDTVCHEHLEYYCIEQVKWMLDRASLKILDITFNDVNGGSFVVIAAHENSPYQSDSAKVADLINRERSLGYSSTEVFMNFERDIKKSKLDLQNLLKELIVAGKTIVGLGASTKGNVLLQYCDLSSYQIKAIGEVNPFKYSKFTPKTLIPIVPEVDLDKFKPDYKLVLPWHFRNTFIEREKDFLNSGGKLIFPLPKVEIYGNNP